jgi:hypothetical protein
MSSISPIGNEIMQKKMECYRQDYILEAVYINPVDLASLIIDANFLDFTCYAKKSFPIDKGEVGKFYGIKIIVTTTVPIHKLLFSVNMGGYRSVQGPGWDKEEADEQVNPSRRYS